ncbi:hypothetical protein ABH935_008035 [Catenulispora sp. GAS73]|uniref:hypothetical protein n=1 Tax=Catenulispora sp. GAS73 TaxID=3156269 RepID=UPI003515BD6E
MINTRANPEGSDDAIDDEEVFAGLRRSVAGATLATSAADVAALGRRTRNRHRALAAGIGTSAAALVAAVGVLAPSAGTGTGPVLNAPPQKAVTPGAERTVTTPGTETAATKPGTVQTLNVQEAGFSMEEKADGTVHLTITQIIDPAVIQSVLEKAGVPAVILVQQVPQGWDMTRGIECTPDPGVVDAGTVGGKVLKINPAHGYDFVIDKAAIPAGDFMTVMQFQSHGRQMGTQFGLKVGRQTTCVPRYDDTTGQ